MVTTIRKMKELGRWKILTRRNIFDKVFEKLNELIFEQQSKGLKRQTGAKLWKGEFQMQGTGSINDNLIIFLLL